MSQTMVVESKPSKKTHNGKLDFQTFIKALELIGRKMYKTLDPGSAFVKFVKNHILPVYRYKVLSEEEEVMRDYEQKMTEAFAMLDEDHVIDLLSVVYKQFVPIFKNY